MKLSNSFHLNQPPAEVFAAFQDVERVATCMPGSRLLGHPQPDTYDGEVSVKVGPLGVTYSGEFTVLDADPEQHRLRMRAKGREKRGAGNADAHIVAQLSEQDGGTLVQIDTDLSIRGKVAQFGRGVIGEVTDQIMQTFAANVEAMLSGAPTAAEPPGGAAGTARRAPEPSRPEGEPTVAPTVAPTAAPTAAPTGASQAGTDLDAWAVLVRPMLQRHAGSLVTVALSGLAAYLGARAGVRRTLRRAARPWPRHPWPDH